MLNNSSVLSHDPQEVALAFNDIASAAPSIVESPAVLQAVLRKRFGGGSNG
jgi:hypothetical protein